MQHNNQVAHGKSLKTILSSLAAAVERSADSETDSSDEAAAAAAPVQPVPAVNEAAVQFRTAYRSRNNRTGTLDRRLFAFGNNPGPGRAPPHMRRMTAAYDELYINNNDKRV